MLIIDKILGPMSHEHAGDGTSIINSPPYNTLMYGGIVTWIEELTFTVSAAYYYLSGILYYSPATQIILNPADPDNPRRDVIIVDIDGLVTVMEGTPAENPLRPTPDPVFQLELTDILIPAASLVPGQTISNEIIYDENADEWNHSETGVIIDYENLTDPFHGLKCMDVGVLTPGDTINFSKGVALNIADYETLSFNIKLKVSVTRQYANAITFLLNGVAVTKQVLMPFDGKRLDWQAISIKLSDITFTETQFDEIRFSWRKSGASVEYDGLFVDFIQLQKGLTQPTGDDQIQSDWRQINPNHPSFIKNKPTLVDTFLELTDTPAIYTGQAGKVAKVNQAEDGLEFGDATADFLGIEVLSHQPTELWEGRVWMINQTPLLASSQIVHSTYFNADDGSITLTASGGSGTYEYSKDGGATWQATGVYDPLEAGVYNCQVRDANYITDVVLFGNLTVTEPDELTATLISTDETGAGLDDCTITISSPSGGASGTYEYSIDGITYQGVNVITNLAPGTQTVRMRDPLAPAHIVNLTIICYDYAGLLKNDTVETANVAIGYGFGFGVGNTFNGYKYDMILTPATSYSLTRVIHNMQSRDATKHNYANDIVCKICPDVAGNPDEANPLRTIIITGNPATVDTQFEAMIDLVSNPLPLVSGTPYHFVFSIYNGVAGTLSLYSSKGLGGASTPEDEFSTRSHSSYWLATVSTHLPSVRIWGV